MNTLEYLGGQTEFQVWQDGYPEHHFCDSYETEAEARQALAELLAGDEDGPDSWIVKVTGEVLLDSILASAHRTDEIDTLAQQQADNRRTAQDL